MLQSIREHTQGWISGMIITLIILSFALWGIHSYFVGGEGNTDIAEVNGVAITKEDLTVTYERLRRQAQAQFGANKPITAKDEIMLKDRALQSLVDLEALKQASSSQGFRVTNRQIDNYLQSMPAFQVNGQFNVDRFQEILSSTLLSTSEFLEMIRTSLLVDQPKLGIVLTSFALPDETNYTLALVDQERDISYATVPLSLFLTQSMIISSEKIKAYYAEHQHDFMTPEQVNVEYTELSLQDLSAKITPTETILKNFYNENINSYTQPMQWKFAYIDIPLSPNAAQDDVIQIKKKSDELVKLIKNGADLANVAHDHSLNLTIEDGKTLNQVPAELQKVVAGMTQVGQVSEPFRTNTGVAIIKILAFQAPKIQGFDLVSSKVKDTYVHHRAEEKFAELRDQLADLVYEHPDTLQTAAKTLNLPIKTSELFTKEKAGHDISQYKKVRDIAFSHDVLTLQNNSDVIQLNPETVIVLRVKSHIASTLLPLNTIAKKQIEDKLKSKEAESRANQLANELKIKLQSGTDPKQLAASYKLTWNRTGYMGRYATQVDSAILDLAFRLPHPIHNQQTYGVARLPSGYAIVALQAVKEGMASGNKQYAVFAEQVQNSQGLLEYELYKSSQMNQTKIKVFRQK